MPADVAIAFVDREREMALFERMLSGEIDKRILCVLERGEQGKTFFLLRLFHECEQQRPPVPVVLLDFDQRRSGLTDYLSVAREVRRYLGDQCSPAICACEEAITRGLSLVSIRTGEGEAGVDWGQRGRFTEAEISDVAGRDSIHVSVGDVAGGMPAVDVAQQQADMGRALCSDLAGLADSHRHVVLLVDTFEHTSEDTCAWLERWLFDALRLELRHVLLVVAGRPECQTFLGQPRLWSGLVATIDRFEPFRDDEILTYYRQRGFAVSRTETSLLTIARVNPGRMADVGNWLEQTRGGAR